MPRWDAESNKIAPSATSKLMSVDAAGGLRHVLPNELQAFVQGKIFGTIAHDAVAPTPGETGEYTFSTGGVCTWLDVFPDTNTVIAGDRVLVIYNVLLDTYSYELQPNGGSYTTVGELEAETAARALADSQFYAKAIEPIAHNATAPTPVIPTGTTKTYEFSSGGVCAWITGGAVTVEKGDTVAATFTEPSTWVYTYSDVLKRKADATLIGTILSALDEAVTEEENARKNEDDRRFTVCNLDVIIPLPSGFYTLQTAIEAATGSTALSGRITPGFELRFKTSASVVHSFIYNGGDKYDTLSWKSNIVDIEKTARIAGDNALQESIDNLSGEIGSESLARTAGDNALQASIDNLSGEIGSESLARTAGDNALQQQIDSLDTAMGDISSALDEILLIGGSI
jgi:hypothetical protein